MKIIANPPYGRGNPDLKIQEMLLKAFPAAKSVFLLPAKVAEDPLFDVKKTSTYSRYVYIFNNINHIECIDSSITNKLFGISTGRLGIYVRDFSDAKFDHMKFLESRFGESYRVSKKIFHQMTDSIFLHLQTSIPEGKFGVKVAKIRGFGSGNNFDIVSLRSRPFTSIEECKQNRFQKSDVTDTEKDESFVCFDDYKSAENFIRYTRTSFMHFLVKVFKHDVNVPLFALPFLHTYTYEWTDKMLYELFGLTIDEMSVIEQEALC